MRWKVVSKTDMYNGHFRVERYEVMHELFEGGWSNVIRRELITRQDAVAVLPFDPVRNEVVLIEQFRIGAIKDDKDPWLNEIVAGLVKPGENLQEVARREAMEEANCVLSELKLISNFYPSPGGFSEHVSIFMGRTDAQTRRRTDAQNIGGIYGHKDEGENIRVVVKSTREAFKMLETGEIKSAIPIIAINWLALHYEEIMREWS